MRRQELHPRTAIINNKQKSKSKQSRHDALVWLAAQFPQAFDNSLCIRPLKLGIMDDILAHADQASAVGISKSKLREAVVLFTRRIDYLTSLKAREMRIDLHGNPTNPVTEDEAERAATKIRKRVEKSAKNARKNLTTKSPTMHSTKPVNPFNQTSSHESMSYYSERSSAFGAMQNSTMTQSTKPAAVVVKHKSARQYDPDAVARLKEKLGLSRLASKEPVE